MRIAIDNLDGLGAVDYTVSVAADGLITIQRVLNAPSRCTAVVVVGLGGLALPVRRARVTVTGEAGTVLFTGYLATEPLREYVGEASEGAVYQARLSAVSDEWLLDKQGSGAAKVLGDSLSLTSAQMLLRMVDLVQSGGGGITVASSGVLGQAGVFAARPSAVWSVNAGDAAGAGYANYRAVGSVVTVQQAGEVVHELSDATGTLQVSELALGSVRELANDVTVSGEVEPTAYVQECFQGDGTTAVFPLRGAAFRTTNRLLVQDDFSGAVLDRVAWTVNDPGAHLSITSVGLTLNGGNGADGVTTVISPNAVEMGGVVVAELAGVAFGAGSAGMLAGFYGGAPYLAACLAGFRVKQVSGATVVVPVVQGVEVGTTFTPVAGHTYTLRVWLHCVEMQRVMQRYYAMVDGVVEVFGPTSAVDAPMDVVFELRDEGVASNTPVTVLYDSVAAGVPVVVSPGACEFAVVNSESLYGAVGSVSVTRTGSLWVKSVTPGGVAATRMIGVASDGVDCEAVYGTSAGERGSVTFFAGRVPGAGELVTVSYRAGARSVARLEDALSVAAEAAGGMPGTARWLGKVLQPVARSSADCEQAAQAILAFATSRACAVAGTYAAVNPGSDIWPGDVLRVTSEGVTSALLVRSVVAEDCASEPEVVRYRVQFANDWGTEYADGSGLKLSEEIAADVVLPQVASDGVPGVLANLQQLAVTSLTATAIGVDAGVAPPSGGGFEVRRRDDAFGVDAVDLVLRSPVRAFTIPRVAQGERYFVRMYDASTPPVYSRWSSELVVNVPV